MQSETIKCRVCGQVFETSETLREHERVMTEDKKYKTIKALMLINKPRRYLTIKAASIIYRSLSSF
jgi:hypothetical protein